MKNLVLVLAATAFAVPALAQDAPAAGGTAAAGSANVATGAATAADVTVGASVVDTSGAAVGTIDSVSAGNAVISTGTAKASVPVASFAKGPNGLVVGTTKAALEAAVAQATTPTQFNPGDAVSGPQGNPVGKIDSVNGDTVVVATASGAKAALPKKAFVKGPNGLVIGMTAAQLEAAVKAAKPAASK